MNGQWVGTYEGTNQGRITVNIDDLGGHYEGFVALIDNNPELPNTACFLRTKGKSRKFEFTVDYINVIHPQTGDVDVWDNVKHLFPTDIVFPSSARVNGSWDNKKLTLRWETNIGTIGETVIPKSSAEAPSEYKPLEIKDWAEFKSYVETLGIRECLFRGQCQSWRLRTKYHRSGRANLERFLNDDRAALYKHLSARTRHLFNLDIPDQNGAFFNLAQHHGYPTPLLDWTYSPFVAAFFAFREIPNSVARKSSKKVRIFVLHAKRWRRDYMQMSKLVSSFPHFSIMEFIAIDNERMVPQQAASTITNIDDIESYLRKLEANNSQTYLEVIELPWRERPKIMRELSIMGITAGSLFPGLDGACEELKERYFEV